MIGIVSKADGQATQGTFWVVPSTEIVSLKQRGGKIIDTLILAKTGPPELPGLIGADICMHPAISLSSFVNSTF